MSETVAIIGSRTRVDMRAVLAYVDALPADTVVLSGGAAGPDSWAISRARQRGLTFDVFRPDLPPPPIPYHVAADCYYARNRRLVEAADRVVAFYGRTRSGGTTYTVKYARKVGKPVEVYGEP